MLRCLLLGKPRKQDLSAVKIPNTRAEIKYRSQEQQQGEAATAPTARPRNKGGWHSIFVRSKVLSLGFSGASAGNMGCSTSKALSVWMKSSGSRGLSVWALRLTVPTDWFKEIQQTNGVLLQAGFRLFVASRSSVRCDRKVPKTPPGFPKQQRPRLPKRAWRDLPATVGNSFGKFEGFLGQGCSPKYSKVTRRVSLNSHLQAGPKDAR